MAKIKCTHLSSLIDMNSVDDLVRHKVSQDYIVTKIKCLTIATCTYFTLSMHSKTAIHISLPAKAAASFH